MLIQSAGPRPAPGFNQKPSHQAASQEATDRVDLSGYTGKLSANPLFVEGAAFDEFPMSASNLEFARRKFGLDASFADLVAAAPPGAKFSVVYHSDENGLVVDAYRAAVGAGPGAVFTAYDIKNPNFDPGQVYRNEVVTPMPGGKAFGTVLNSKRVVLPETAPDAVKEFLRANEFELKETVPLGSLGVDAGVKGHFGLQDEAGLEMYELKGKSFTEKFSVFYRLFQENSEYRVLKIADAMGDVGAAMLLGVITPKLWEQGAAYGIASTISSIGNVGSPLVGILGESILGSVVDNAVNSEKPLENLKKVNLATAALSTVTAGCYFALHPQILGSMPIAPAPAFIGLYALSTLTSGVSGVMSGKANFAIHDQLINKSATSKPEYTRNFFQILGVEASISRAIYLGCYTATVAAGAAFPGSTVAIAGAGAGLWAGSNFLFSLYREKPDMKVSIEGSAFVHEGNRYVFDSGWEVAFDGPGGRIVKEDDNHYSVSFGSGEMLLRNDQAVDVSHTRRLKDRLPDALKPKFLGEKEHWELDDGAESVEISRYGFTDYELEAVSDREFRLRPA